MSDRSNIVNSILLSFLLLGLIATNVCAQQVAFFSESLSVTREACAVYCHLFDLQKEVVVYPIQLPGNELVLSPVQDNSSVVLWVLTGLEQGRSEPTPHDMFYFLSAISLNSYQLDSPFHVPLPPGWVPSQHLTVSQKDRHFWVAAFYRVDEYGIQRGRLDLREYHIEDGVIAGSDSAVSVALEGAPIDVATLPGNASMIVLTKDAAGIGGNFEWWDVSTGTFVLKSRRSLNNILKDGPPIEPKAFVLAPDGQQLALLGTGCAGGGESFKPVTYFLGLTVPEFELIGDPLELPGIPKTNDAPIRVDSVAGYWVLTYDELTASGHILRVVPKEFGFDLTADIPIFPPSRSVIIQTSPQDSSIAIAAEPNLDIWRDGIPTDIFHDYPENIRALVWSNAGLFVGAGNALFMVDPQTALPFTKISVQSGHVREIVPLRNNRQRDKGEILPSEPVPGVWIPPAVVLRDTNAPILFRRVPVGRMLPEGAYWQSTSADTLPRWLRVEPIRENGSAFLDVEVLSAFLRKDEVNAARLSLDFIREGQRQVEMSRTLHIYVLPKPERVPRILWLVGDPAENRRLRDPDDPRRLSDLLDLLASAPFYFTHVEPRGSYPDDLARYRLVVLDAEALCRGALTRATLLDYVTGGGSVLFLGKHKPEADNQITNEILAPMGIHLNLSEQLDGQFVVERPSGLLRHWDAFGFRDGCLIQMAPDFTRHAFQYLVPEYPSDDRYAFLARTFGLGRLAGLISVSPLENDALKNLSNRRFASDLFRWLVEPPDSRLDKDGDGLLDALEDKNGDGVINSGETSPDLPDTDGDGVPDGNEDRNRNGKQDAGETSPVLVDSDEDGIWDGSDSTPTPVADAPIISSTQPSTGPAEGGTPVLIIGKNLSPKLRIWFGETEAKQVSWLDSQTVLTESPPSPNNQTGVVPIRVRNEDSMSEGSLANGFLYTEGTRVKLFARIPRYPSSARSGELTICISTEPPTTALGSISLLFEPETKEPFHLKDAFAGALSLLSGREIKARPSPSGGLWIDITPGKTGTPSSGELVTLQWELERQLFEASPIRLQIKDARVKAANGVLLKTECEEIVIQCVQLL